MSGLQGAHAVIKGTPGMAYHPEQFHVGPRTGPFRWGVNEVRVKSAYEMERERLDQFRKKDQEVMASAREREAQVKKDEEIARIQLDMNKKLANAEAAVKKGEQERLLAERRKTYGTGGKNSLEEHRARYAQREAERAKKMAAEATAKAAPPAPAKKEEKLAIRPPIRKKTGYEGVTAPTRAASRPAASRSTRLSVVTRSRAGGSGTKAYVRSGRHAGGIAAGAAALGADLAGKIIARNSAQRGVRIKRS